MGEMEMISSQEANLRKIIGTSFGILSIILYVILGPFGLPPWGWMALVGIAIGFYRTGVQKE
jgi:hypothetical protein